MKKIAVVGSEEKYWTPSQRTDVVSRIKGLLENAAWVNVWREYEWDRIQLISGGCHKGGVDIWAEVVADVLGVQKKIFLPENYQWAPNGYRKRNIQMAKECDELWCFDPEHRDWSGGMWTANFARKMGKPAHVIAVREEQRE